jgi:hypothetical protein
LNIPFPHFRIQFNYGKNNKELADFAKGPIFNENAEGCKQECNDNGGCMDSTSLEIMWSKPRRRGGDPKYQARLHLGKQQLHWHKFLF